MEDIAIRIEQVSKLYRLGIISSGSLKEDIGMLLAKINKREDEYFEAGEQERKQLVWALKDITFDVKKGEVLGLIGKNGAGKSTLLKILSRVTEPTRGRVKIRGRIVSLLEVGTGFHPELTGKENVFLNGAILGMSKREILSKYDEIVEFSGVSKYIDTPVKRYSSGMYVRLAFAVAAHLEPEILIVDEVLAVGDAEFQAKCLGKIKDVSAHGRTVVFVSHSMAAVRSLCQSAVLIDQGQVTDSGDVGRIVDRYLGLNQVVTASSVHFPPNERPGNVDFKVIAIRIRNQWGDESNAFFVSADFTIEIEYEVLKDDVQICLSVSLNNAQGDGLFASLNTTDREYDVKRKQGVYMSSVKVFGSLLNCGKFHIAINGYREGWSDHFGINNVLSFEMLDDNALRGDYKQNYGGSFRPKLEWNTKAVSNSK
ncbi:MAG TPA: ABC transporter ATP-binding protein [Bacteroidia bacterium]|jgi:lipopolysaccharide transport system ATP-binding protein|nr:ABC transporter ATP-binding protein [Bacteroidia bacterium]